MNAKPILLSAPMVRALLDGRKTQTRRIVKPQPDQYPSLRPESRGGRAWVFMAYSDRPGYTFATGDVRCPYGEPGDLLVVREAWQYADWTDDGFPFISYRADGARRLIGEIQDEWSDRLSDIWADLSDPLNYRLDCRAADRRWRSPVHMPRWASRITLRITDVRVQRLHDITEGDAAAECVAPAATHATYGYGGLSALADEHAHMRAFRDLWASIHGPGSWGENPWVWALTFEVLRCNIDEIAT